MNGLLLVDKPKGWTSFDVVAKVRSLVKQATGQKKPKVGHTGTLDPLATGLLVLCIGSYCKRAQEFSKLDKVYEVEMTLGQTSSTDDDEGEKQMVSDSRPSKEQLEQAIRGFVGEIMQTPSAFSAIKVDGKRAYKMARAGQEVKLEARPVTIHSISEVAYEYPIVRFTAHVGSGTYIRSLVRDIGDTLQTGAYMGNLRRTRVGVFELESAATPQSLSPEQIAEHLVQYPEH